MVRLRYADGHPGTDHRGVGRDRPAASRALVWPLLDVPRRGYVVRDKDLVYKAGVLWRSVKAVPYNRVQHAETASGPLDRRYGLARLTVFTAGGSGGDLRVDGLSSDVAERSAGSHGNQTR